jgi:hypothetical protein
MLRKLHNNDLTCHRHQGDTLKTRKPFIVTARIKDHDLAPFDRLRLEHFPTDRNFLRAHLTMFHRLPGEYEAQIQNDLAGVARNLHSFNAQISGLRHLGAGVAFSVESTNLHDVRATLKSRFLAWLGPQDLQKWQPHITVQNKSSKIKADALYRHLNEDFEPHPIEIEGLDLWEYLGGPWQHHSYAPFNCV